MGNIIDLFHKCSAYTRHKDAKAIGLYPYFKPLQSGADAEVIVDGKKMIMLGSNNYLGLTQDPRIKEAAINAIKKYGSSCTGSRFLNGTIELHEELEYRLAKFVGKQKAICFSTGFQTNLGAISALVSKDDVILIDRMNHASIIDGCRLSYGKTIKYRHNDVKEVENILKTLLEGQDNVGCLLVTDGVFSMEGDLADLPGLVRLKKQYNFKLMVDDAHAIGVMGKNGRGTSEHFGVEDDVDLVMGTFSKSFASLGGFIVGREDTIDYIMHFARSLIFSASMPPANIASVIAALDIIEKEPERRERLWKNTHKMANAFRKLGFNLGNSQTPVIPIIVGDLMKLLSFWKTLFDNGVYVNPIIPPAVPEGMCLLRTSYMATHTDQMLDRALEIFEQTGKKLGII